jgi:hypothetical protein
MSHGDASAIECPCQIHESAGNVQKSTAVDIYCFQYCAVAVLYCQSFCFKLSMCHKEGLLSGQIGIHGRYSRTPVIQTRDGQSVQCAWLSQYRT